MKVLGIVCSPRKNGNTEILVRQALLGAAGAGAETELWSCAGKDLHPCDGCRSCASHEGKCHIQDDMQELYPKIIAADGLVFGSPSYFESISAQGKIVIDRLYGLYNIQAMVNKVAGIVMVAGSSGHDGVRQVFRNFIDLSHMIAADRTYGFANDKGTVVKDQFAMVTSEEQGKQIVSLIEQKFHWPVTYKKALYKYCREKYDIPSCPTDREKGVMK